jgi:hypothetical protein
MIIYGLLLLLIASFTFHIVIIILYIKSRDRIFFYWFIAAVVMNLGISLALAVIALTKPLIIKQVKLSVFLWLLSGFIAVLLLIIKLMIFRNIYRRMKDPNWYHLNYFGKKVYERGIIRQEEFLGIFVTFPFFLITGAFFISRLIHLVMFGGI